MVRVLNFKEVIILYYNYVYIYIIHNIAVTVWLQTNVLQNFYNFHSRKFCNLRIYMHGHYETVIYENFSDVL